MIITTPPRHLYILTFLDAGNDPEKTKTSTLQDALKKLLGPSSPSTVKQCKNSLVGELYASKVQPRWLIYNQHSKRNPCENCDKDSNMGVKFLVNSNHMSIE